VRAPRPFTVDVGLYLRALPLYARNLAVALPPFLAAIVGYALGIIAAPLTDPIGGAGGNIFGLLANLVMGFAFGTSLILADAAWRHGRANLASAWDESRRKAGNILIATFGFLFMLYVAGIIGHILGAWGGTLLTALAVFGLIYTLPATSLGGTPGFAALNRSIQIVRSEPIGAAILTIVSLFVYYYVGVILPDLLAPYLGFGAIAIHILLPAIAAGYVALVMARQFVDVAFSRRRW